ncbi:2-succinyl-5-enolpyruvyl-6-hydroxy-3-cyclohexene-1-carboxylic-acid synthase [Halopenitus persicus]|uniref:2-succinyl-5-enolpyruvyl-6-hydroxy-3-cyclohexene-1-carboxylate synthase n=1 Tax=Halopenitus persicus TaxID=1048396 RepID=A0A1H3JKJ9_9EURY|nr:2-succinyl-5-enolpyruvyl-6-hydroxy-3-cyclohexene-1-carboxylic-acid synthase [Halopenitus persicus]SDY40431.1 2-succinyl-5-enolpyruvyl-6-hydroxy-3-cyclohexene-1-carboxylate synthase [Halopenitus persicus]
MTAPNRNTLWATAIVDELASAGVSAAVASPGSRSTPLTLAFARHEDVHVFSQLDERSAAFFALGRARRTGEVTPLVCTSGTAAANYHPTVMEADQGRVPLLALTADRPPELRDSGANQTADQEKLYGDAVRYYKDLPEPAATDRALASVRTTVARAIAAAEGTDPGPVHLNVPFAKPLEPTPVPGDVPADLDPAAEAGREGPYVATTGGATRLDDRDLRALADALATDRGLIVAGPADPPGLDAEAVTALSHATGHPILADPLSGLRFGGHTRVAPVIGGYDAYLSADLAGDSTPEWRDPEVVLRLGAAPTSKSLRKYLTETGADQYVVDPVGRWREAEFAATDLVVAEPNRLCGDLSRLVGAAGRGGLAGGSSPSGGSGDFGGAEDSDGDAFTDQWERADAAAFSALSAADAFHEGRVIETLLPELPDPATLFVSNSMPVRDLDRFGRPGAASLTVCGNRGVSGIDGIVSSALGAGSATTDDLTLLVGDLALHHDSNGLLALDRCDVDATIVAVNNDGGGIFHELPIEEYDPEFTEWFKTPHGIEFETLAEQYDLEHVSVDARDGENASESIAAAYRESLAGDGSTLIEVRVDAESSHRVRERLGEKATAAALSAIEE